MRVLHGVSLAVLALAATAFVRWVLERQDSAGLRAEVELLAHENRRIAELQAVQARLLATRVSDAELEQLRSDRVALAKLRAEINRLEDSADRQARALRESAAEKQPSPEIAAGVD